MKQIEPETAYKATIGTLIFPAACAMCAILMSGCGISQKAKYTSKVDSSAVYHNTTQQDSYTQTNETKGKTEDKKADVKETDNQEYTLEEVIHTTIELAPDTTRLSFYWGIDSTGYYEDADKLISARVRNGILNLTLINKPKTIPATGYKKETGSKATSRTDNTTTSTTENGSKSATAATQNKGENKGAVAVKKVEKQKEKTGWSMPWWVWAGGILLLVVYLWSYFSGYRPIQAIVNKIKRLK